MLKKDPYFSVWLVTYLREVVSLSGRTPGVANRREFLYVTC